MAIHVHFADISAEAGVRHDLRQQADGLTMDRSVHGRPRRSLTQQFRGKRCVDGLRVSWVGQFGLLRKGDVLEPIQ